MRSHLLIAISLLTFPLGALAESVGFIAGMEGEVSVRASGEASYQVASVDRELSLGDSIQTGRNSAAKIVLTDDTVLSVGEETVLVLDAMAVGSVASGSEPSIIRQLQGQIRTTVGEIFGGPTRLEIHTATATMGVKGTELETRAREGETLACVHSGDVSVRSSDPDIGSEVDIPEGLCRYVYEGEAPEDATPPPGNFTPLGPGPSSIGGADTLADQILESDRNRQHYSWLGDLPPVAAGPGDSVPGYEPPEGAFDDALDAFLSTGNSTVSVGGGPSVGGGEAPGEDGGEGPGL